MDYLPFIFNTLMLLFWVRLWSTPEREFYFNPFLSGTVRLTDSVLTFLRPVFSLPEQAAALLVLLFAVAFKTLMLARLHVAWVITCGLDFRFSPAVASAGQWGPLFLFSTYHFCFFLLKFWSVYLLVKLITPPLRTTRALEALDFFARPFSRLPFLAQPLVLALLSFALTFAVVRTGELSVINPLTQEIKNAAVSPFLTASPVEQLIKTGWLAALALADGLELLIRALFVFILGNLGAALFQAQAPLIICSEGVELLLGRFARSRTSVNTGLDFTPLIFFFVVDMFYRGICIGLSNLIHSPLFN